MPSAEALVRLIPFVVFYWGVCADEKVSLSLSGREMSGYSPAFDISARSGRICWRSQFLGRVDFVRHESLSVAARESVAGVRHGSTDLRR